MGLGLPVYFYTVYIVNIASDNQCFFLLTKTKTKTKMKVNDNETKTITSKRNSIVLWHCFGF